MFNLNINFMKKQLVIFILLGIIAIPSSVKAQKLKVSLSAGLSKSILNSDVSNLVNTRYDTKTGVATRVNLEYNFFKDFIVGTGLGFIQKNYEYKKTDNITGTHTLYKNNFMDIPLNVGLYLFNNPHKENGIWLKVQGGVFYEYFTRMHRKGEYPIFAQLQEDGSYMLAILSIGSTFLLHIPISMVLPIYTKQKLLLIVNQKESQTSYR